jgi:DNA repair exonuclease SbcCD ATPase subunit
MMIHLSMSSRLSQCHARQGIQIVPFCVALLSITACVKESTYQAVQIEITDVRRTLAREKDEVNLLTAQAARLQEVKQEQEHNVMQLVEALQQEKNAEALWQKQARQKTDALVARLNAIQSQQRWLARETEHAVKEQETLEALVAKYKGELQDSVVSPEPVVSPAPRDVDLTASQPSASTPPVPAPPPAVSPVPPPSQLEPETQPARQKPIPESQDESWFSTVKGWLGSIWRMIFS